MEYKLKVLIVDANTAFYRINRYPLGDFFGPVDLGLHLSGRLNSLNIGAGLFAGSIFPGTGRLVVNGFSPCWGGFYISSMGGAGLVFDNLGINMLSIVGRAPTPSILYLNRIHGEEVDLEIVPVDVTAVWREGRGGVYSLMDYTLNLFGERYTTDPRILAVGPASQATDFGAIASAPIRRGELTPVDTWAGRGGFGSKLFREHGIAAILYGGTFIDEDFRDRTVADRWFEVKYDKRLAAKDIEATTKYRYDKTFSTGGTFGVNFATLAGRLLSFNCRSMYLNEEQRLDIHQRFVRDHYLRQFNEETIQTKQQKTCGEPCAAVCKKMRGEYKKDYEPYQAMGPLSGVFDQRAAERLVHHADQYGFDAISVGGVVAWLMECLDEGYLKPEDLGVRDVPVFSPAGFDVVADSAHNGVIGVELLDGIIEKRGVLDLERGARRFARHLSRDRGREILDLFIYTSFGRQGWMVPNQYWTPGVLSPMAIMGKYYMHYGREFVPPRELGRLNAERFKQELIMDNLGVCRFHRGWAEEMLPEIVDSLYGLKEAFLANVVQTATRINSRNASVFWETERNIDFIYTFLKREQIVEGNSDHALKDWIVSFERNRGEAALSFWYEVHKGISESLKEF